MLMDPHHSQQHSGLQKAVFQLQQEVTRPNCKALNCNLLPLMRVFPGFDAVHSPLNSIIVQTHASSTSIPHCGLLTKDCPGPILLNLIC